MKLWLGLLVAAFAILRVVAVAGHDPLVYPDTDGYLRLDFLGGDTRLWTVPLLFTWLPGNGARVVAQVAIGIACWSGLALAAAAAIERQTVAVCTAAALLLLGLTVQVVQWDLTILSESLTLSLTALCAALALFAFHARAGPWVAWALLGAVLLWAFTRHLAAAALVVAVPVTAGLLLWRLPRRPALATVACLAVMSAWALVVLDRSPQWRLNGDTLLVERLLQDPDAERHFAEHGLEVTPGLKQEVRVRAVLDENFPEIENSVLDDPGFQRWFESEWASAYASYLMANAPEKLVDGLRETPRNLAVDPEYAEPDAVLPGPVQDLLWNRSGRSWWIVLFGSVAVGLWLLSLSRGPPRPVEVVPWVLVAVGVVLVELVWNSTATEIPRLVAPAGVALVLGFLLLAAFALDRLLYRSGGAEPATSR